MRSLPQTPHAPAWRTARRTIADGPRHDQRIKNAVIADGQSLANWSAANAITVKQLCSVNGGTPTSPCLTGSSGPAAGTVYYVSVQVTGTFKSLLSYPGLPPSLPVSGNAIMRVASQ